MRFTIATLSAGIALALILALSCTVEPVAPVKDPQNDGLTVTGVTAVFKIDSEKVFISWRPPSRSVDFYRIYRTTATSTGGLDTSTLVCNGFRRNPPIRDTSFGDVVGLANALYWYEVRAVIVVPHLVINPDSSRATYYDTIEGNPTSASRVSCNVTTPISFSINHGDVFITTDTADIVLVDRAGQLDSVLLTDSVVGWHTVITIDSSFTPPKKDTGTVPDLAVFTTRPGSSNQTTYAVQDSLNAQWVLPQGTGTKWAAARIHYKTGRYDTLFDNIQVAPYRVEIKFRNRTIKNDMEMDTMPEVLGGSLGKVYAYTILRPWIDFSVEIFSDSTFDTAFDCWIIANGDSTVTASASVPDGLNYIPTQLPKKYAWLETTPLHFGLTGRGSAHNDRYVYRYNISPDSIPPGSLTNPTLRWLRKTVDTSSANPVSISGSYEGDSMAGTRQIWSTLPIDPANPDTGAQNFAVLKRNNSRAITAQGSKEFSLVLRMRGRYFNDVRTIVSSKRIDPNGTTTSFLDFYPPRVFVFVYFSIWPQQGSAEIPIEGAVLRKPFRVSINHVEDLAGSAVTRIQLGFAKMPPGMAAVWNPDLTPLTLTLDSLLHLPHELFDFPVPPDTSTVTPVFWDNIDPTGWPSGDYMMFFATADRGGNYGLASLQENPSPVNNPWHVQVLTGQ